MITANNGYEYFNGSFVDEVDTGIISNLWIPAVCISLLVIFCVDILRKNSSDQNKVIGERSFSHERIVYNW